MATLADELLNDFEDSEPEEEDQQTDLQQDELWNSKSKDVRSNGSIVLDGDEEEDDDEDEESRALRALKDDDEDEDTKAKVEKMQLGGVSDVRNVAGLMKTLEPVLAVGFPFHAPHYTHKSWIYISFMLLVLTNIVVQKINHFLSLPQQDQKYVGSIEDNPEYNLLTESNTLSTSIDDEIILVHKFIRDHYSTRFPELETLVSNPLDYAKAVAIIGNGPMDNIKDMASKSDNVVGTSLRNILTGPTLMVVTVEASTSRGRDMTEHEVQRVLKACEMTLNLDKAKGVLNDYVQSRMNLFAPNLTALIGSLTAAQLLNFAGGLTGLAKTPACNLPPLGSKKQSQSGLATNVGLRQQGFLYYSPIVQGIPADLKRQALRIVSAKVVLAARVDRVHSSPNGADGEKLLSDCIDRLDKLMEPPPNSGTRALPAPDDKPSRKRGGRRARKAKEQTAMTELKKEQNRMAFGKEEKEVGYADGTKGMGMIGQSNEGRIRNIQADSRTRAKLSKNNKGWGAATPVGCGTASSLRGFGQAGGSSTMLRAQHGLRSSGVNESGTASTIAFTPVQGLELVDPKRQAELKRKLDADNNRYFGSGTFTQIGKGANSATNGLSGGEKDGFKIPGLPMKKAKIEGKAT